MKKILTVSLFAMMAVSAANAEIASTDYVDKQLQPYSTTAEMEAYVADELGTMQGGLGDAIDTVASNLATYQTTNNAAVAAAKKAGDDAQADIDAYIESNDAALALKANSADVYTKTAADAEFMNSSEVSTAIANAVTGDNGALKDYVTNEALTQSQSAQDTTLKAYADDAAAAAKSGAEATAASALSTYQTTNDAAVAAAKKAGDDAQADIDAYIESNDAALALKANSADVYTKTAADAEFMNSSEVSTAIANAVTGDNGALKDYSTTAQMNTAITNANDTQTETITNAYKAADTALETSLKSYADTAEADAIAAAKTAGDAAYDVKGAAAAAQTAAVNAAELAADAKYQVKSSALSVGAAGGEWTDLTKAAGYSETGTHSLVLKNGTIQWEAVSY